MNDTSDSQMEGPSTPTDATATKDKDFAPSPEPPSTRPNPFDDSDLSARKRRRTSGSASPPPSASTHDKTPLSDHVNANKTGAHDAAALDQARQDKIVTAADVAESLRTPQTPVFCAPTNSTPQSSSKVTLNLRSSNGLALDASEPSSPTSARPAHVAITDGGTRARGAMVYAKNAQQPNADMGTSSKSTSDSTSPPVELISVSDVGSDGSDDEMVYSLDDKATGILSHVSPIPDPILQFPFSEPDDDPSAPLHHLLEYLSSRTCASYFIHCRPFAIRGRPTNLNKIHLLIAKSLPKYKRGSKTT